MMLKKITQALVAQRYKDDFFEAVDAGNVKTAKQIIDKGIDINIVTDISRGYSRSDGSTYSVEHKGCSALHVAVAYARGFEMVKLLVDNGIDVERKSKDGLTAIAMAARAGSLDILKFLSSKAGLENNLLNMAARSGKIQCVAFLLDSGIPINSVSDVGESALHAAVRSGNFDCVMLLVERGIDIDLKMKYSFANQDGECTAAEYAGLITKLNILKDDRINEYLIKCMEFKALNKEIVSGVFQSESLSF